MLWCIQLLLLGVGRPASSNLTQGLWDMEGCVHQNDIILLEPWNWTHLSSTTKTNVTDFSSTLYLLVICYRECKTGKTKVILNKLKVTGFNLLLISSIVCTYKVKVVNNAKKNSIKLCKVYQCKSSVSHWEVVAETGLVYYWIFVSQFTIFTLPLTHLCCVPPKLCISIVFNFSWDDCNPQEELETVVMQHVGGGGGGGQNV